MANPYWHGMPGLRTDTSGFIAFILAAGCLATSEYLRLRRRRTAEFRTLEASAAAATGTQAKENPRLIARAVSETVAMLATGLVCYLSVNAVTHPATLLMRATHLLPWPSEGTLRVVALLLCFGSVSALRFLRASANNAGII
jgi:hypothetical protein